MSIPDITFNDGFSAADISEIERWLGTAGHRNYFRTNLATGRGHGICAIHQSKAVGFISWKMYPEDRCVMKIPLCAVKPDCRSKGIGHCLVEKACTRLEDEGCSAVHLECDPPESHLFWRSVGFLEFPPEHSASERRGCLTGAELPLRLYKIIGPFDHPTTQPEKTKDVFELWPGAPNTPASNKAPGWQWSLPACIVAPSEAHWRLRVTKGTTGAVQFDGCAADTGGIDTGYGDFLVLFADSAAAIAEKVRQRKE